jgi:hypothetical protein
MAAAKNDSGILEIAATIMIQRRQARDAKYQYQAFAKCPHRSEVISGTTVHQGGGRRYSKAHSPGS